jgi:hypothetical protein
MQFMMAGIFIYDITLGLFFSGLVIMYELYYLMLKYDSSDRKKIKLISFLAVLLLLLYIVLSHDASNLVILLFMFFNSLFIFSYYKENNLNKRRVIDGLRYFYPVVCILFNYLGYYHEFVHYLFLVYPLLFINFNKSKLDVVLIYVCTIVLLIFRENIFNYGVIIYLILMTIYYINSKSNKNLGVVIPLLMISILVSISLNGVNVYKINSRVFENELFIIKIIKAVVGLLPLIYFTKNYLSKLKEKKYKINNDIFILILSVIGYLTLIVYTRIDVPFIIITIGSLLLVILYKLQCDTGRRITDKVLVITSEVNNENIDLISSIKKYTKVIASYKNDIKNSLNVQYIINKESNYSMYKKALKNKKYLTAIKEGIIYLVNLYKEYSMIIEYLYSDNSKYLISFGNSYGALINSYANANTIRIVIFDDKNDDEEHVLSVASSLDKVNYILFNNKKMLSLYEDKVIASNMIIEKDDKKILNNLTK